MDELTARTPDEVLEDHLHQGQDGTVEEDLSRNYAPEVVVLPAAGTHRGHDGLRELAERLRRELPDASCTYTAQVMAGGVALLEWTASTPVRAPGWRTAPTPSSSAADASRPRPSTTPSCRRRPTPASTQTVRTDYRRY